MQRGLNAVYDADLKGYFDSIPHEQLLACVRMRVKLDRSVLKLIRMWLGDPSLRFGAKKEGAKGRKWSRSEKGTPQGGVISPLLANLYLHWFDKEFHRPGGPAQWAGDKLVRYADDFVVLSRYPGKRLYGWIRIEAGGVVGSWRSNQDKTRVINLREEGEPGLSGVSHFAGIATVCSRDNR